MNGKTNANGSGGASTGISIPLEPPTNLALSAEDSKISLTWTDPNDKVTETYNELVSQWSYDSLVRKQGSAPTSITDGTLIAKITDKNQYQNIPYVDTGMENDKEWFYSVFAHNQFNTPSDPIYGSDIPTANVVTTIKTTLNIDSSNCSNGNGLYYFNNISSNKDIIYNTNLVSQTLTTDNGHTNKIYPLGNAMIYIRKSSSSRYIDSNLLFHDISIDLSNFGNNDDELLVASIDDYCVYIMTGMFAMFPDDPVSCMIDRNFIVNQVSEFPTQYTGSRYSSGSGKNCAYFIEIFSHYQSEYNYKYLTKYDTNGTNQMITMEHESDKVYTANTAGTISRCADHHMWMSSAGDMNPRIFNDDMVVSKISLSSVIGDSMYLPYGFYDMYSIGCGMVFFEVGAGFKEFAAIQTIDRNLTLSTQLTPELPDGESCYVWNPDEQNKICGRVSKYIFIHITNTEGRNNYQKYLVLENGYESDIKGG